MSSRRKTGFVLLTLTLILTTACSISFNLTNTPTAASMIAPSSTTEIAETTVAPEIPTNTPQPTATTEIPTCPTPSGGDQLFTLDEAARPFALCFLYPFDFTAGATMIPDYYTVTGTPRGEMAGSMSLSFAPAGGKTLEQYAADTVAAQAPGMGLTLEPITMGAGIPAIRVDGIPGMVGTITLFLVHNDTAFTLTFLPSDTIPDATADMLRLYVSVTTSWVFTR